MNESPPQTGKILVYFEYGTNIFNKKKQRTGGSKVVKKRYGGGGQSSKKSVRAYQKSVSS